MQAIIELLLSNIFIIVLLIGGLISVFNRNKQQEETNRRTRQGGENKKEVDWKTIFQQESDKRDNPQRRPTKPVPEADAELVRPEKNNTTETNKQLDQYQERLEQLRSKQKAAEEKMKKIENSPVFEEAIGEAHAGSDKTASSRSQFVSITRKEAINGIIWAEILGEPKARRPQINNLQRQYRKRS
ncbi:hypothetical protein ACE1TI_13880 [Alteribacillus sp. JSM 102045]|uniref:hypothetical protein n=1 Tax=Alteribacillus sp. JSM 102045 TaxID=1562101 RepID=UPI0035BFBCBA